MSGAVVSFGTSTAMSQESPPSPDAADLAPSEQSSFAVHGFASQGYVLSTANDFLAESEGGSFEFAEAGVNLQVELEERLRVGVQLFARDLGPAENYSANFDWFHLDYRFADWLGIRAGRAKLPFGLYNEVNDVDVARVFVLLPQSVYPTTSRDYLLAVTGLHLYGYLSFESGGGLDYRAYVGTNFLEVPRDPRDPFEPLSASTPYMLGGRVLWDLPVEGLRLGPSVQVIRLEGDLLFRPDVFQPAVDEGALPGNFDGLVRYDITGLLGVASIEYAAYDLQLAAEYSRWRIDLSSSTPQLFPAAVVTSERFFALAAYRVTSWLTPGAYYSAQFPNVSDREGRENYWHDFAATLRFDLTAHWLLKLEGHLMLGTAGLSPSLNGGAPRTELEPTWGLFLAKTTAYF
jgi:hypothetical protein